ncbi:MAG: PhoU domain-containing protein [Candidatus Marinimicrobia bacterium]|jgi:phosphate uptake regulator|nr:PhoU domain-containing protein [Candidatus Neomarinimicrobiota bacterium]MDP6611145.1 PhoU domain-containing protein [Candidatus Neomarinimicrobiota bacterium]|tara:strand:+ start:73 stop:747 length:675 start_codon:yes stop_codon:yes gene_type:complete
MTIIKDIINLWKAEDLLSQAWNSSYEMMELSREIFNQAIQYLRHKENIETLKALKKRDQEINAFQQEVRRKVLTHYAIEQDTKDMVNGLILINMVVDIERIGDYCKNILDLAINYPDQIIAEDIENDLAIIEEEVKERFDKTIEAIHTQDSDIAKSLMEGYREQMTGKSDNIVNGILRGDLEFGSTTKTSAIALYARYLKRIGAHLKNITTTLVNPFDSIGYKK